MTQASLSRPWVVMLVMLGFMTGLGYGLYMLWQNAPALLRRIETKRPPVRGSILSVDGAPLVISRIEDSQDARGYRVENSVRMHPLRTSASQLIGFSERATGRGISGLELDLEEVLVRGQSVPLTLDSRIQALAEQALQKGLESSRASWGSALVMKTSGELLAVANAPFMNPTGRRDLNLDGDISWRNHAFSVSIEPGSTIKALTAATLLEEGAAYIDSRIEAPMQRKVGRWTINDITRRENLRLSLAEVLRYSSNVGISKFADRLDSGVLYKYFDKLHLSDPQPLSQVYVASPNVRNFRKTRGIEYANATFGQGFSVTPLHLTAAFNALANDGVYQSPTILDGQVSTPTRVFRPEVTRDIRTALKNTYDTLDSKLPGYALGGKTGTAQVVVRGRYSKNVYTALFAGFLPAEKPQATVVVVLYHPKGKRFHGSQVAAPVYRDIASGLLALWGIPPAALGQKAR
jgi:cell division protein FtsI (penicillin-binding protein 3)